MRKIRKLQDVVDWGLCIGCGACAFACDRQAVSLVDVENEGIRPVFKDGCAECSQCLTFCPGAGVDGAQELTDLPVSTLADREFGPALEIWEGYAADPEIRFKASSGGLLTALSLYCLEREGMESVVHSGMSGRQPWKNETYSSRDRAGVLDRTGSRYAPSSPCEGLSTIEAAAGPCVFVGKPCDTAAVSVLRKERDGLDEKVGLVLTFFCAGTPSTGGTLDLIDSLGSVPSDVQSLHYRGEGWPGRFRFDSRNGGGQRSLTYSESWGRLTRHRPLRCNLCPDGLGRSADLACGDAWNEFEDDSENPGLSIVLVRTENGRRILHGALAAGYVKLKRSEGGQVLKAQQNLLNRRRQLFGRLSAMRMAGIPVPRFRNFSLFYSFVRLPVTMMLRVVASTLRRVFLYKWWLRRGSVQSGGSRVNPLA